MTAPFVVEKGVPIPTFTTKPRYPWYDLEVGDSFFVPHISDAPRRRNFRGMCAAITRRTGLRFVTRVENGGVRVWLVERPADFVRPARSRAERKPSKPATIRNSRIVRPEEWTERKSPAAPENVQPQQQLATVPDVRTALKEITAAAMPKDDQRRARGGWMPGLVVRRCERCDQRFNGDRKAYVCADCAYAEREATDGR